MLYERGDNIEFQGVTITASADGDIKTKTERQADGKVFWTPGDAISIFYGTGNNGGSRFTSTNTETAAIANFIGKIGVITGGGEISLDEIYFWGVYPYREDNSCDGTSITTYLPAEQEGVADTFADDLFPTMGRNLGLSLAFYNICGGIRFSVARDDIRSVTFRGNNGEVLAGRVKVVMQNGAPVVSQVLEPETEITLTAPDGGCFKVGKYYYMVALPADLNNGFTMTLETDNQTGTREMTSKVSIKRSSFGSLNSVDSKATFTAQGLQFVDPAIKNYCLPELDKNHNGEISQEEAENLTEFCYQGDIFSSMEDLGHFTNLKSLECINVDTVDVSHIPSLESLKVVYECKAVIARNNPYLKTIKCGDGFEMTTLDVSGCPALEILECYCNQLTSLDVSHNPALIQLICNSNRLTSLDISNNPQLEKLECFSNELQSLNTSSNPKLKYLSCGYQGITELDLSNNPLLKVLSCNYVRIPSLDISSNLLLDMFECYGSDAYYLETLIIDKNQRIKYVNHPDYPRCEPYIDDRTQIVIAGEPADNPVAVIEVTINAGSGPVAPYASTGLLKISDVSSSMSFLAVADGKALYWEADENNDPMGVLFQVKFYNSAKGLISGPSNIKDAVFIEFCTSDISQFYDNAEYSQTLMAYNDHTGASQAILTASITKIMPSEADLVVFRPGQEIMNGSGIFKAYMIPYFNKDAFSRADQQAQYMASFEPAVTGTMDLNNVFYGLDENYVFTVENVVYNPRTWTYDKPLVIEHTDNSVTGLSYGMTVESRLIDNQTQHDVIIEKDFGSISRIKGNNGNPVVSNYKVRNDRTIKVIFSCWHDAEYFTPVRTPSIQWRATGNVTDYDLSNIKASSSYNNEFFGDMTLTDLLNLGWLIPAMDEDYDDIDPELVYTSSAGKKQVNPYFIPSLIGNKIRFTQVTTQVDGAPVSNHTESLNMFFKDAFGHMVPITVTVSVMAP